MRIPELRGNPVAALGVGLIMGPTERDVSFSVNFDYRCPFARNANEHVVAALEAGSRWQVRFVPFSLSQAHVAEGDASVWDRPEKRAELVAIAAGVVVRDRFAERFRAAHLSLFAARHDAGGDLRSDDVVRRALDQADVDPDSVFAELDAGWPFAVLRDEHERSVAEHEVFGVPTFVLEGRAAFVRIMTRPLGDAARAEGTISRVIDLLSGAPELNEFKHTTIDR
ncbi:MAG TPA: DsbA family protein [Acidimicrobiales bacterium]|nr:DsbA family protein [Acidimicrobiales bacterium]